MNGNVASMLPAFHQGLPDKATMFGTAPLNAGNILHLQKALNAGVGNPAVSGGPALQIQSLEATLRVVTYTLQNIKFWKMIPKLPAFSTAEEYNLLREYGSEAGIFTNEGELAQLQDSLYERNVVVIKFLATQREISHPMLMVRPAHGNVVGLEAQNGAVWLLEQLERNLFFGNSAIIPQSFDGLDAQLFSDPAFFPSQVIDLRGRQPTEDDLEEGANRIVERYGVPTDLFMMPRTLSAIGRQFYPRERIPLPLQTNGIVGLSVQGFESSAGVIRFQPDVFIRPGRRHGVLTPPTSATSPFAPAPPSALTNSAPAGTTSLFDAASAGAYSYFATALNRFGESAPLQIAAPVTYAAGQSSTLSIVAGSANTTGFRLYRTQLGSTSITTAQLIREIPIHGQYVDDNFLLPGHGRGYMVQGNVNNMAFKMLAPMLKIPLATIAASIRWMQVMYGAMVVYSPLKNVCYLNMPDTRTLA